MFDCDLASCPEAEARSTFPLVKQEKRNLLLPNPEEEKYDMPLCGE